MRLAWGLCLFQLRKVVLSQWGVFVGKVMWRMTVMVIVTIIVIAANIY